MKRRVTARADSALEAAQTATALVVKAGSSACDATLDQVAAQVCASRALLAQYRDDEDSTTIGVARASIAPVSSPKAVAR